MLWYCKFKWHSHTTVETLRRRILEQESAGTNHPERIRGWYDLAGGGAGFMLIDTDEPRELADMLQPYTNGKLDERTRQVLMYASDGSRKNPRTTSGSC